MKKNNGFTLIEVLVALAILAIALTAIIRSTSQNTHDTLYLQNKTIASWVALDIMNQARAGLLKLPEEPGKQDETETFEQKWPWQASMNPTPNPKIKKITVTVDDPSSKKQLIQLVSYIYVPE